MKELSTTEAGWTSNAPTKEGWYWWQRTENDNPVVVWVNTFHPDKQLRAEMISGRRELLTHFTGLFNGPITPDSYQQGRVDCLGDVKRYVERQIKMGEDFIGGPDPNIQRRVALDEVIEYCDRQLAQQAQDEKGVGE